MKKVLLLLIVFCAYAGVADANRKFDPAKFKAELHKYIIVEARLTQDEVDKFFPLYDEMKQKQMKLHKGMGHHHKKPTTEAACRAAILNMDNVELKKKQIERTYHLKFLKVLSASKLYDVLRAEAIFHRKAFRDAVRRNK